MKETLYFFLILTLFVSAAVASGIYDPDEWQYVWIGPVSYEEVRYLQSMGLDLDNFTDSRARFYVKDDICEMIRHLGYEPVPEIRQELDVEYPSLDDIFDSMTEIVSDHPDICRLETIGSSVQGRDIRAVVLSDNPGVEEVEPELRIHGGIHGDEPASSTVTRHFLDTVTDGYVSGDPVCTYLINTAEIWVIPVLNPDGYVADARYNANGIDLNRNLSYMGPGSGGGSTAFSEPETAALRDLTMQNWPAIENFINPFAGGLSLHGGAACINTVWNYTEDPLPEDYDLLYAQCQDYKYDPDIVAYFGSDFLIWLPGASWYIIHGDVNDWSYGECGTIDHTIEVHENKHVPDWPAVNIAHYNATLSFFVNSTYGIYGTIVNSLGDPLDALIEVGFSDIMDSEPLRFCRTDVTLGDYHKTLVPGTYDILVTVDGLGSQLRENIVVGSEERVEENFVFGTGVEITDPFIPSIFIAASQNPFSSVCCFNFSTGGNPGTIRIFDVTGRKLLEETLNASSNAFIWNGKDNSGSRVPPGVYLVRLEAGSVFSTTRVLYCRGD